MSLHINKDRDNLKDEGLETNEQLYSSDFGFYYYDLKRKNHLDQKHIDALIDMTT